MCSPRELALPNAPQKRGIIELDDSAVVGGLLIQPNTERVIRQEAVSKPLFVCHKESL